MTTLTKIEDTTWRNGKYLLERRETTDGVMKGERWYFDSEEDARALTKWTDGTPVMLDEEGIVEFDMEVTA